MAYLKFKACRRLGENISGLYADKLTPKQNTIIKLLIKKNTSRKQSDFSKKLQQWKKLAYFYGIRSLKNRVTSNTALSSRLDKKKSLLLTLETRLDVILVRLYFCSTLFAARQLITHNKIRVNLNVVNLPGFTVKNGDIISIIRNGLVCAKVPLKLVYPKVQKIKLLTAPGAVSVDRLAGVGPKAGVAAETPLRRFRLAHASAHWDVSSQPTGYRSPEALANRQHMISVRRRVPTFGNRIAEPVYRTPGSEGTLVAIRDSSRYSGAVSNLYHFEVNYKTFKAVLLYEPTQIHFPYKIDLDLLF